MMRQESLRPDPAPGPARDAVTDPLDMQRAQFFALLGRLLVAPPDAALLRGLAGLDTPGAHGAGSDGTPLGMACAKLAAAARAATPAGVAHEYHALFIGVGRGELLPFASYYLTGFLHERPLALLRDDLGRLGIARSAGVVEPEDHLGFLCEAMAGLIAGDFAADPARVAGFFARHVQPWAGRAFADLQRAEAAGFYRVVGEMGGIIVDIETAAAALPA